MLKSTFWRGNGLIVTISLSLCFLGSVTLDQVSKQHMHETMLTWEDPVNTDQYAGSHLNIMILGTKSMIRNPDDQYLSLGWQYSRNKGAAFSMFSDMDDKIRVPMFYGITFVAVILIFFYLRSTPLDHYFSRYGLVLVLAGAIGNFIDRLHRGYVVDFIDVDWSILGWQHDFAIFNVADVSINIGIICLLLDVFLKREQPKKTA